MPKTDPAIRHLREHHLLLQIARRLKVSKQATAKWRRIPAARVLAVAKITGLDVHFLRPDLYPAGFHRVLMADESNGEVPPCQHKVDQARVSGSGGSGSRRAKSVS